MMEPLYKSEHTQIEIKEEICQVQPKSEPIPITFDTIQTHQIKREKTDYNDSTACSTIHDFEHTSGVSEENNGENQLMPSDSTTVCTSANIIQLSQTRDKHFLCDVCNKKFTYSFCLKTHMRTHSGRNRPAESFSCDVCTKKYTLKKSLRVHLLTHTGEKPFSCDVCTKKYTLKKGLRAHLLTHTGEKPFSCDVCTKKYTLKRSLRAHLLTHTGQKPFSCDVCTKKFYYRESLKSHLFVHTGHKPFPCDICAKKFSSKDSLSQHSLRHTLTRIHYKFCRTEDYHEPRADCVCARCDQACNEFHPLSCIHRTEALPVPEFNS